MSDKDMQTALMTCNAANHGESNNVERKVDTLTPPQQPHLPDPKIKHANIDLHRVTVEPQENSTGISFDEWVENLCDPTNILHQPVVNVVHCQNTLQHAVQPVERHRKSCIYV